MAEAISVNEVIDFEMNIPDRMGFNRKQNIVIDKKMYKTAMSKEKILAKYGVYEYSATALSLKRETQSFSDEKLATIFAQRNSTMGHAFVAIRPKGKGSEQFIVIQAFKDGRLMTFNKLIESLDRIPK